MSGVIDQIGSNSGFVGETVKKHQYTTLANSWVVWSTSPDTTHEGGVTIQNTGRVWIANISAEKNFGGTGTGYEIIVNIKTAGGSFTMPRGVVTLGMQHFGNSSDNDYISLLELHSSGNLYIYYNNSSTNYLQIHGNFIGLDVS